jgi:hypothetical protein
MAPRVVEDLLRRMTNAQQENAGRVDTERAAMTATRYHLESKIEKLVSAITDAGHSPALLAKLASLEGDKAKLEIEITALDDAATPLPPMSADEIVEVYNILINDHVLKLFDRDAVSDQNAEGAGHMRNVLRSMIERITLTPLADDSGLEASLQGDFCNILASVGMGQAIESKDPSAGTEGSSSSVVAGARIGRDRHSLMVVI